MLVLMRHGRTGWNELGRLQGQQDSLLTIEGQNQAKRLGAFLADHLLCDTLYCSPLQRAVSTANIILSYNPNMEVKYDNRLKEMSFGDYEGYTWSRIPEDLLNDRNKDKWSFRWSNGESYSDVFERACHFVSENPEASLVLAHETVNRCLLGAYNTLDSATIMRMKQPNNLIWVVV